MSVSSLSKSVPVKEEAKKLPSRWRKLTLGIIFPLWVLIGFILAQIVVMIAFYTMNYFGVSFNGIDQSVLNTVIAALIYLLSLSIVLLLPLLVKKYRTSKQELGLTRLPSWMDIVLAPAGVAVYFLCAATLIYVAKQVPGFDINQVQETGFDNLMRYYEYLLAFITLVVIAPIAEEVLFRGYLYGKLRKFLPVWVAVVITSVLFGFIHAQWNVAIDVFALSIVACTLREVTGSIWAGILLHMLKNGLAFYLLFINPALLHTIGG